LAQSGTILSIEDTVKRLLAGRRHAGAPPDHVIDAAARGDAGAIHDQDRDEKADATHWPISPSDQSAGRAAKIRTSGSVDHPRFLTQDSKIAVHWPAEANSDFSNSVMVRFCSQDRTATRERRFFSTTSAI
jgi:hypothetical protein